MCHNMEQTSPNGKELHPDDEQAQTTLVYWVYPTVLLQYGCIKNFRRVALVLDDPARRSSILDHH